MTCKTERLRELLDERGVEYYESPNGVAWGKLAMPIHGRMYTHYAVELDGLLCVDSHCITPEQVIEATLGRETCHVECFDDGLDEALDGSVTYLGAKWFLSCGHEVEGSERPRFCVICGKRVVEEL